jgi:sugar transferase (PEP-CTERM/EpsH1 system associated)
VRDLLFLAHRIPFPPNKGDKIRSWNVLRYLATRFRVHLGCFIDDPADWQATGELTSVCASCHFAPLDALTARMRGAGALLDGKPLSVAYYRHRPLAAWVRQRLAARPDIGVFVYSSAMAQYLNGVRCRGGHVIDFVDVDSEKWRGFAARKPWPRSWLYGLEARRLLAFDRRVAAGADASLFVTRPEAELFRRLAPESAAKVHHMGNGVDFEYFAPGGRYADPYPPAGPTIVFTGMMGYWPNVEGVCWFVREVLPRIRAVVPDARFAIVGTDPAAEVLALARNPGVLVTGRVLDVRPYIAHARVAVAPLHLARGVQNKVLEAMAMAKIVVATPQALEGIDAEVEREVLMAPDADGFAREVVRALEGKAPASMGDRARARVVAEHGWAARLAVLDSLLDSRAARAH